MILSPPLDTLYLRIRELYSKVKPLKVPLPTPTLLEVTPRSNFRGMFLFIFPSGKIYLENKKGYGI